ncbi:MAG: argininosuccinate synthase domain-containing protein, partial [Roseovarius sp.]
MSFAHPGPRDKPSPPCPACENPVIAPATSCERGSKMSAPKKVVLAYSGGLDTSIILKWLQTEYG